MISLSRKNLWQVFLLCLLAGCSICWFNTVCYVLCIRNFPANRPLALSLSISFNGVSAALYTLIANAVSDSDSNYSLYLLLNALVPLLTSSAALLPVLRPPPPHSLPLPPDSVRCDSLTFLYLNIVAIFTGLYLLLLNSLSSESTFIARILFSGAVLLLALPIFTPGITYARGWARRAFHSKFEGSSFNLVDVEDLELHKELIGRESPNGSGRVTGAKEGFLVDLIEKDQVAVLGEEHPVKWVVRRRDFWLYYAAYFCGGTIGLVYSNNLGQISQSLGFSDRTSSIVTLYSACSFFGRLLSAAPDFLRE